MKYAFFCAAAIIFLSGCASTPTAAIDARQVPKDRVFAYQERLPETTSTIIVTRDSGFFGSGCNTAFSINGILSAKLDAGETAQFFLAPGEILLRSGLDPQGRGLCGWSGYWTQRETILRPGETKRFRMSLGTDGKFDIQRGD